MREYFPIVYLYVLATVVCIFVGLLIWYATDPSAPKRFAVRWWKAKPNWLWGVRNHLDLSLGYFAVHPGPLELLYRSRERAKRLFLKDNRRNGTFSSR